MSGDGEREFSSDTIVDMCVSLGVPRRLAEIGRKKYGDNINRLTDAFYSGELSMPLRRVRRRYEENPIDDGSRSEENPSIEEELQDSSGNTRKTEERDYFNNPYEENYGERDWRDRKDYSDSPDENSEYFYDERSSEGIRSVGRGRYRRKRRGRRRRVLEDQDGRRSQGDRVRVEYIREQDERNRDSFDRYDDDSDDESHYRYRRKNEDRNYVMVERRGRDSEGNPISYIDFRKESYHRHVGNEDSDSNQDRYHENERNAQEQEYNDVDHDNERRSQTEENNDKHLLEENDEENISSEPNQFFSEDEDEEDEEEDECQRSRNVNEIEVPEEKSQKLEETREQENHENESDLIINEEDQDQEIQHQQEETNNRRTLTEEKLQREIEYLERRSEEDYERNKRLQEKLRYLKDREKEERKRSKYMIREIYEKMEKMKQNHNREIKELRERIVKVEFVYPNQLERIKDVEYLERVNKENARIMEDFNNKVKDAQKEYHCLLGKISSRIGEIKQNLCQICCSESKDHALSCGHMYCGECVAKITQCAVCRIEFDPTRTVKLFV